ncbi:sulfatase-like hydrolase/transferase [Salaquimonas pukyongi]|uniref:sulfatase-like hydrolase/transferase n=1 Tax=Salaquimonas pukyongi TaxID=2712698 RepID=UPI00096BA2F3|nr:sulfatase-like hydrolase/transferase [Salaquimonas pukyongi]
MSRRKNVLFIIIDQFRADCLAGLFGNHVPLPNLRGFMAEAVTFNNHVSVTSPCGPSRISLLTGQYAMNHRSVRNGTPLPHDKPNLATEARKAGYLPLLYGYTDTTMDPRVFDAGDPVLHSYEQVMPGFVEALEMRLEESWPWRAHLKARGYKVPDFPEIFRPAGGRLNGPARYRAEDSDTAFLTDRVIDELLARPGGWFGHVTYIRPHPPFVAPEPYNKLVDPAGLPAALTGAEGAGEHPYLAPARADQPMASTVIGFPDLEPTPENIAMLRAIYLGLAAEVDHHFGRILAALKSAGLYEDTIVMVSGDHGEMLGDYGLWGKHSYHDAAFRVPLIIRDPDRNALAGKALDLPSESVDLAPTLLEMIGAEIPGTMDGKSLVPLLEGQTPANWRRYTYSELEFGNPLYPSLPQRELGLACEQSNLAVIRDGRYNMVHFNGGLPPLLFDMNGEGEARDISRDPGSQDILLRLTQAMLDHRMTHAEGRFSRVMITGKGVVENRAV